MMKPSTLTSKADYIGITGSVLCILHCLATPVLLMTVNFAHESLKVGYLSLDYVFILVNVFAVYHASKHAHAAGIRRALWGFLGLFTACLLLEDYSERFEYIGYAASLGLVVTHLVNLRTHHHDHEDCEAVEV
jgi:hypothetical protein